MNSNNNQLKVSNIKYFIIWSVISFIIGSIVTYRVLVGDDLLSFIGTILGVFGAYIILKLQIYYEKKIKQDLSSNFIKELLIHTVSETEELILYMINSYINVYVKKSNLSEDDVGFRMLKENIMGLKNSISIKSDYELATFPHLIEELQIDYYKFYNDPIINKPFNSFSKQIIESNRKNAKKEIVDEYINSNFIDIIYDQNWSQYIHDIDKMKFKDRRYMIRWLTTLSKDVEKYMLRVIEISKRMDNLNTVYDRLQEKINNEDDNNIDEIEKLNILSERFEIEIKIRKNFKEKQRLEKSITKIICDFIYYRDEVISILKNYFEYQNFSRSTELLKNRFKEIENSITIN